MESVGTRTAFTAHSISHGTPPTPSSKPLIAVCRCLSKDLFVTADNNQLSLWRSIPLILLDSIKFSQPIEAVLWDQDSWKLLVVGFRATHEWTIIVDADLHLVRLQKSDCRKKRSFFEEEHADFQKSPLNASQSAVITMPDAKSVTVTTLVRLLPPVMSRKQLPIRCIGGSLEIDDLTLQVSDVPIHAAAANIDFTLIAVGHGPDMSILKANAPTWRLLTRALKASVQNLAWIGADLLATSSSSFHGDVLSFWVVSEDDCVSEIWREPLPGRLVAMDSSFSDYLVVVLEEDTVVDEAKCLVYQFNVVDKETLLPKIVAERRLPHHFYTDAASASNNRATWQLDYHAGQLLVKAGNGRLLHARLSTPWQCLHANTVKFFRISDALVVLPKDGSVMTWDLRTARCLSTANLDDDIVAFFWAFDRGLLTAYHSATLRRLREMPVIAPFMHWLASNQLTVDDLAICSDDLLELLIANAVSEDRVHVNRDLTRLVRLARLLESDGERGRSRMGVDAVLIRVLRKMDPAVHSAIYSAWKTTADRLFEVCLKYHALTDACAALILCDRNGIDDKIKQLNATELDDETREQLDSFRRSIATVTPSSAIGATSVQEEGETFFDVKEDLT